MSTTYAPIALVFLSIGANTFCAALDTMNSTGELRESETLISSNGTFELGFFSPGISNGKYIGIWYKKITPSAVVWVLNRDNPLTNSSGAVLKLVELGNLALVDGDGAVVWSTNFTSSTARNPFVKLLDSGNLVVKDANDDGPENFLWQSFDHPTDTLIAGMKLGRSLITGREIHLSSWRSGDNPGTGDFNYYLEANGYPQTFLRRKSDIIFRAGPWNGVGFGGVPGLKRNDYYGIRLTFDAEEIWGQFERYDSSRISRMVIDRSGIAQHLSWVDPTQGWVIYLAAPMDRCDSYMECGPNAVCAMQKTPICECLDKFIPAFPNEWAAGIWSNGCVRRTALGCKSDKFLTYSNMKMPDTRNSWYNVSMSIEECRLECLGNCSCEAYATLDVRNGGSGCLLWFGALADMKQVYGSGQDIFIRVASSELEHSGLKKREILMRIGISFGGTIILCVSLVIFIRRRKKAQPKLGKEGKHSEKLNKDADLPTFDLSTISKATDGFSPKNLLGEGGFGPVYKGILEDGKEVAVKRLSKTSMQGLDEFENEVIFIAKLQHRNLVKLLGCYLRGEEKILIYEYMPNGSLDSILFDPVKSKALDWPMRFHIMIGIARGLLYLHQDSRLRIVHRDLKASNVLLDVDMTPKISDFGLARRFSGNETEANTTKVVGTFGYMSPEYAIDGLFSLKSDVFSFGVIVLEIISGKRNRGFIQSDHHHNLLGRAWVLHSEGRSIELVNENMDYGPCLDDALKAIHVGLLCVQKKPEDRPNMSSVIFMLENDVTLPQPRQPGFFDDCYRSYSTPSTSCLTGHEATITMPR